MPPASSSPPRSSTKHRNKPPSKYTRRAADAKMSLPRILFRYWPVLFMVSSIIAVATLPLIQERGVLVEPSAADSVFAFLTAPPFFIATTATILSLNWAIKNCTASAFEDTEFMAMVWHLTNGTWWSCGCDSWSGLFRIMPRMRKLYLILDTKHGVNFADQALTKPWSPAQSSLEAVYWAETLVHVPLSLLTFYLYATRNPNRYLTEAFVGGAQLVGCFGYYGPELLIYLHGFPTTWPNNWVIWWIGIGCVPLVWCLLPILLTVRAALLQVQMNSSARPKGA